MIGNRCGALALAGALLGAALGALLALGEARAASAPTAQCPKSQAGAEGGAFAGVTVFDEGDPEASLVPDDSKETPALRRQFWKLTDYKPPFGAHCAYKGGAVVELKLPDATKLCELDTRPGKTPDGDVFLRFFCN
jgi:hypothetical protein